MRKPALLSFCYLFGVFCKTNEDLYHYYKNPLDFLAQNVN